MSIELRKLIKALEIVERAEKGNTKKKSHGVKKGAKYINPVVGMLLLSKGNGLGDTRLNDGTSVKKAMTDYYGEEYVKSTLENFNSQDRITGVRANRIVNSMFDMSKFFEKMSTVSADENTYQISNIVGNKEVLVSPSRLGRKLTVGERQDIISLIGNQLYARSVGLEYDLKNEILVNNAYNKNFVSELEKGIGTVWSNDLLRLAINGTSDSYPSDPTSATPLTKADFYKQCIGIVYLLQNLNGKYTNSDGIEIDAGRLGYHRTPVRISLPSVGTVTKYSELFAATSDGGYVAGANSTINGASDDYLKVSVTASNSGYATKSAVKVEPYMSATMSISVVNQDTDATCKVQILGQDNVVIYESISFADVTTPATKTLTFNTDKNMYVKVRLCVTNANSGGARYSIFDTISITQYIPASSGRDIITAMSKMVAALPSEHHEGAEFTMSRRDLISYSDAKGASVEVVNGTTLSANNTTREDWVTKGTIPPHLGYPVTLCPVQDSVSEYKKYGAVSMYGVITFGNVKNFAVMLQNKIISNKEWTGRLDSGGPGYEYTKEVFFDAQLVNGGATAVAYIGATCETPFVTSSADGKAVAIPEVEGKIANGYSAETVYVQSDDIECEYFYSYTSTDLADYETAKLNCSGDYKGMVFADGAITLPAVITHATTFIRAFKHDRNGDELLTMSAVKTLTVASSS